MDARMLEETESLSENYERLERECGVKKIRADEEIETGLKDIRSLDMNSVESEGVRCSEREGK